MSSDVAEDVSMHGDSEDDDWEEVDVPVHERHLEITLDVHKRNSDEKAKKRGISHAERLIRIDCHKIHTIALISNAIIRNRWVNDPLLQARLLSLTPLHLQNAFGVIHKSRVPDQNQRGRMFERAMEGLTNWWAHTFFEVVSEGHIRNHTYEDIQQKLEARGLNFEDEESDADTLLDEEVEIIRSPKSLMKHALMQSGSRDTSAQLFTALCRGLGIATRLVVSIQSVPWQAGIDKPRPSYRKPKPIRKNGEYIEAEQTSKAGSSDSVNGPDGISAPTMSEKAKGKQKAKPKIKLRKTKDQRPNLGRSQPDSPDPLTSPPVFWTEVFSRPDSKWFPVDPIRGIVNKRTVFDPTLLFGSSVNKRLKVENRMLYVLAFEEDGYARDVTRRYAKQYAARVAKMQGGSNAPNVGGGGKGRQAWWDRVVNGIHRPYRLHRDDVEDQEFEAAQMMEGMPTTMSGFKDHPIYVLERHLKQTETIYPNSVELGKFKGEPVYPRSAVVSLKSAENWMRTAGRTIKEGEQSMKTVKARSSTVNKIREREMLVAAAPDSTSSGEVTHGLYAYSQTEPYVPDAVVDGIVPKNNFGNIDLYVPSMLPQGAVHLPYKGVAKIAKKLGFDYAEAVIGFEFKKRRAFPIIEGVVVAVENEEILLEAFWEAEKDADEKARIKKEDRVLKQWTRLIHGLRIRERLQKQYGSKSDETKKKLVDTQGDDGEQNEERDLDDPADSAAGGFLEDADKVVAAFHLPKNTHVVLSPFQLHKDTVQLSDVGENESDLYEGSELRTYDLDEEVMDVDSERSLSNGDGKDFIPKTMQQLAEDAARREMQQKEGELRNGVKPEDKKHSVGLGEEGLAVVSNSESSGRVTRSRSGAVKTLTLASGASEKMARGRRSLPSRQKVASTNKISRKRKRASVEDGSEPEPEVDAETSNDEQDIDFVGDDTTGGGDGDDDDDGEYISTRGKRSRIGQTGNTRSTRPRATSTFVARPSTRAFHTPRARRAKTTSRFEEES